MKTASLSAQIMQGLKDWKVIKSAFGYWSVESFSEHSLVENNKPHEMQKLGI